LRKNTVLPILLIDNYDSFTFNIVEMLRSISNHPITVVKNDQIDLSALSQFEYIILSPGPALPADSGQLLELFFHLNARHKVLGICLGHQAIAEFFGGQLIQLQEPRHGHATSLRLVNPDVLYEGIDITKTRVGLYHSWAVNQDTLPPELCITAFSEEGHVMSLKHRSKAIHGVQFHPESFISSDGARILQNFLKLA
jgi:anthranilate synthase component 2